MSYEIVFWKGNKFKINASPAHLKEDCRSFVDQVYPISGFEKKELLNYVKGYFFTHIAPRK